MIARTVTAGVLRELEAPLRAQLFDQRIKLLCRASSIDGELVVVQSAHHVEVEHADRLFQRKPWLANVMSTPQKSPLLARKSNEDDAPPRPLAGRSEEHTSEL